MTNVDRGDYDRDIAVLKERVDQMRQRLEEANRRVDDQIRTMDASLRALMVLPNKIDDVRRDLAEAKVSVTELRREAEERQRYNEQVKLAIDGLQQNRSLGLRASVLAVSGLAITCLAILITVLTTVLTRAIS